MLLTNEEITTLDCVVVDYDYSGSNPIVNNDSILEFARKVEVAVLAKLIGVGVEPAAQFNLETAVFQWLTKYDYHKRDLRLFYTADQLAAAVLRYKQDAERYRYLRRKVCVIGKSRFCGEDVGLPMFDFVNLPDVVDIVNRDAGATLDNSIDAAIDTAMGGSDATNE